MPLVNWRVLLQLTLGITLSFLFFYMMSPFLIAIFLGGILAIICYPLHTGLTRRLPGSVSALIVTLALAIGIFCPIFFLLYSVSFKILGFVGRFNLASVQESLLNIGRNSYLNRVLAFVGHFFPIEEDWLTEQSGAVIQKVIERLGHFVAATLAGTPTVLLGITVTVVSLYFLLLDGRRFARFISNLSPLNPDRALILYQTFETSCRGVVLGIFLSGVAQGVVMCILFAVCGLPNALLTGSLTVVLGMVPLIGSSPVWIGATVYLFAGSHPLLAAIMLGGGIAVSTLDNIVRSWVMSGQSELHPLLALVSVFGAVNLFGAPGILLGPIIAAVFVAFLKIVSLELKWGK